jgi:hypothetical protein
MNGSESGSGSSSGSEIGVAIENRTITIQFADRLDCDNNCDDRHRLKPLRSASGVDFGSTPLTWQGRLDTDTDWLLGASRWKSPFCLVLLCRAE